MPHANVHTENPDIPGLQKLVDEMQDFALKHPYDLEDALRGVHVNEGCMREFNHQGVDLVLLLSANRTPRDGFRMWSLSVGRKDHGPLADKFVEPLAMYFFQDAHFSFFHPFRLLISLTAIDKIGG